jgi:hypothetical protein
MVLAHGAAITVDSEPGRGSRFDLYLPLADDLGEAVAAAPAPPAADIGDQGEHLLYIDDEVIVEMAQALLLRAGYSVTV